MPLRTHLDVEAVGLAELLSLGSHVITASVTDSRGLSGSDQITLEVTNEAPIVTITAPPDGSRISERDSIVFTATAMDAEDGDLSADVVWTSSKDGRIGTGASIAVTGLSRGRHTIEAEVTDAAGQSGSDTIRLRVSR